MGQAAAPGPTDCTHPHVGIVQRMSCPHDCLLRDSCVPVGLDLQYCHLGKEECSCVCRQPSPGSVLEGFPRDAPCQGGSGGAPQQDARLSQACLRPWHTSAHKVRISQGSLAALPLGPVSLHPSTPGCPHREQMQGAALWARCRGVGNTESTNSPTVCLDKLCRAARVPLEQHSPSLPSTMTLPGAATACRDTVRGG